MFVRIANEPRLYAWGSKTAIAELLGRAPSGGPEAELWLGAHPGSPSVIVDPGQTGGALDLAQWIAAEPAVALGSRLDVSGRADPHAGARGDQPQLPYLLKILAADSPLSLQAHPSAEQAKAGFRRENDLGIPLDAPHRNYRDPYPKPELVVALSERFDALCGFRDVDETCSIIRTLLDLDAEALQPHPEPLQHWLERLSAGDSATAIRDTFAWLASASTGVATLVDRVTELVEHIAGPEHRVAPAHRSALAAARLLAGKFPGDPGVVISLMLNKVTLNRGEALYLPAGNIHAYLSGLAVELMASSDNVLRGGLTPKHVDVPELLSVLAFDSTPVPYLHPEPSVAGIEVFRPPAPDFLLLKVALPAQGRSVAGEERQMALPAPDEEPFGRPQQGVEGEGASYRLRGAAIAICTEGRMQLSGLTSSVALERGQAVYITPDEGTLAFTGRGELFVATVGSV